MRQTKVPCKLLQDKKLTLSPDLILSAREAQHLRPRNVGWRASTAQPRSGRINSHLSVVQDQNPFSWVEKKKLNPVCPSVQPHYVIAQPAVVDQHQLYLSLSRPFTASHMCAPCRRTPKTKSSVLIASCSGGHHLYCISKRLHPGSDRAAGRQFTTETLDLV